LKLEKENEPVPEDGQLSEDERKQ
jgi:hypothetical protein